ncbi:uncharacterized protein A4U43_C05F32930 [Asparagus officinalis]|uniref:TOG domain-containing protein n=1 Tax=Asparagus officinalis TaxID=4686 RepID=A0A5P1F0X1_ASPOF|nr:splicing factor 3B subunit 1-like isoform X1 [Asparagus officinalis]XP_020267013.1 splicing factor 3B subunit 1-like [Asparagus officinalis]ONK70361.1 uncharacterized protein A4U43_C05F32930 [Asparagus officinalis]
MECEEMKNKGNASHKRPIVVNESVGSDDELSSEKKLKTNSRELVKNLLSRVMNDSSHQKSVFFINLTRSIHDMGIEPINVLDYTLSWMLTERKSLKDEEAGFLLKVMSKVLPSCDEDKVRPLVSRIILVAQPFVEDASSHCCIKASEIIYTLSKITGLDEIAVLIRLQMNDSSDYVRDVAVKVMGIVASALGIHVVFPFIESCCRGIEPLRVRCAAIRMVEQFAVRIGCTLLPHLSSLIELMEFGLLHKDLEIVRIMITALSLAALAKAVAPYGYEHFKPILHRLFDFFSRDGVGFIHRRGKVLGALVKLFTCIIQLLTYPYPSDINWNVANGVLLVSRLSVDDEEMKEIGFEAIKSLVEIKDVPL